MKHKDKLGHFVAGVLVALVGLALSGLLRGHVNPSDGVGLALLAGVGKEVFDYAMHRRAGKLAVAGNVEGPPPLDTHQSILDGVSTLLGGLVVGIAAGLIVGRVE